MPPENYASKQDLHRVEEKVDTIADCVNTLTLTVQGVRDQLIAREAMEKQAQVLLAEVNAARAAAAAEKATNAEAWNALKTRALWAAMAILLFVSFPGLAGFLTKLKAMVP